MIKQGCTFRPAWQKELGEQQRYDKYLRDDNLPLPYGWGGCSDVKEHAEAQIPKIKAILTKKYHTTNSKTSFIEALSRDYGVGRSYVYGIIKEMRQEGEL